MRYQIFYTGILYSILWYNSWHKILQNFNIFYFLWFAVTVYSNKIKYITSLWKKKSNVKFSILNITYNVNSYANARVFLSIDTHKMIVPLPLSSIEESTEIK